MTAAALRDLLAALLLRVLIGLLAVFAVAAVQAGGFAVVDRWRF